MVQLNLKHRAEITFNDLSPEQQQEQRNVYDEIMEIVEYSENNVYSYWW